MANQMTVSKALEMVSNGPTGTDNVTFLDREGKEIKFKYYQFPNTPILLIKKVGRSTVIKLDYIEGEVIQEIAPATKAPAAETIETAKAEESKKTELADSKAAGDKKPQKAKVPLTEDEKAGIRKSQYKKYNQGYDIVSLKLPKGMKEQIREAHGNVSTWIKELIEEKLYEECE